MRRTLLFLPPLLCLLVLAAPARADAPPPLRVTAWPQGYVDLSHGWRFHPGDNPAWARPDFDDGSWPVASFSDPGAYGLGYRWFRLRLQLPPQHGPLLVGVVGNRGTWRLYLNGRPTGSTGLLPTLEVGALSPQVIPLPAGLTDVQIALRVRTTSYLYANSPVRGTIADVIVGTPGAVRAVCSTIRNQSRLEYILSLAIDALLILAALAVLALFFNQRSHPEYLWLGLLLATLGASDFALAASLTGILPSSFNALFGDPVCYLVIAFQIEFTFSFVHQRITRPWRIYEYLLVTSTLAAIPLNWLGVPATPYMAWEIAATTPGAIILPILLLFWYRRGNREAGWLIVPSLFGLSGSLFDLGFIAAALHWQRLLVLFRTPFLGAVGFRPIAIADFTFFLAIAIVIFLRFARVSRAEARAAAELDAAREIQRTLVPLVLPEIEGCRLSSAYLPAEQVGGDFYQILKQTDGSTLIVVGDVSGKGLKAAMNGTLAIGALRTLAATGLSPAALLAALNREILHAQQGGFITAVCARIDPGGEVTFANAGHLHPYCNGDEIILDSALPLGTTPDAVYTEARLHLVAGDALTFLSDGVVEARNAAGELFGFDRTRAISRQSAEQIAQTAQSFGQQDDITVLTLAFAPSEVLSA